MEEETCKICSLCGSKKVKQIDTVANIAKCLDCSYIFVNPRPTKLAIKKYYSQSANFSGWLSLEADFDRLSQRRLDLVRSYKQEGTLLDVGAGVGQFLNFARKYFQIKGTEVAINAIKIAHDKYGIDLSEGEVETMDFGQEKFDVITVFHVLEHVHDPGLLLSKCKSLLKKDGVIIIAVPNDVHKFLKLPLKKLLRFLKIGRFKHYGPFGMEKLDLKRSSGEIHLSQFTNKALSKYFVANNYRIISNSLDPYYVPDNAKNHLKFSVFNLIKRILGVNWYDTMLFVVADKK